MNDRRPTGRHVLTAALSHLERVAPSHWRVAPVRGLEGGGGQDRLARDAVHAWVTVGPAMGGGNAGLHLAVVPTVVPRDVPHLKEWAHQQDATSTRVVTSSYLNGPTRTALRAAGVPYLDATGHAWIYSDREPHLLFVLKGATADPWRTRGRPGDTLAGEAAARLVRALADPAGPVEWKATEVARVAGVSIGATYRVVGVLREQAAIDDVARGRFAIADPLAIIDLWTRDYGFMTTNDVVTFLAPRGLTSVFDRLASAPELATVTGSFAVPLDQRYVDPTALALYAPEPHALVETLGIRPTEGPANVLVAVPRYGVLTERARMVDGIHRVTRAQCYADLLTMPGRAPEEARDLRIRDNWEAKIE